MRVCRPATGHLVKLQFDQCVRNWEGGACLQAIRVQCGSGFRCMLYDVWPTPSRPIDLSCLVSRSHEHLVGQPAAGQLNFLSGRGGDTSGACEFAACCRPLLCRICLLRRKQCQQLCGALASCGAAAGPPSMVDVCKGLAIVARCVCDIG